MNKSDLVDAIAEASDLTKADATKALDAFMNTVKKALKNGDDVALVGFGTFTVAERAARTGRNPSTQQAMEIPAAKVPKFRPGKGFKELINPPPPPPPPPPPTKKAASKKTATKAEPAATPAAAPAKAKAPAAKKAAPKKA